MKIVARILVVLVILAVIPVLFGNRLVERYAVRAIEDATGFSVVFDELYVGILKPVVRVRNLVLSNPPDFPHPEALAVRELYVRYNPLSLLGRNIRLHEVRLDVPRVVMVKPERGDSNIEALSKAGQKKDPGGEEPAQSPDPAKPGEPEPARHSEGKPARSVTIDQLNVKFGEMEVRQYRRNQDEPMVITIPVGLNRSYQNVTNIQETATALASELIVRSGIGILGNLEDIKKAITNDKGELNDQFKEQIKEIKKLFRR